MSKVHIRVLIYIVTLIATACKSNNTPVEPNIGGCGGDPILSSGNETVYYYRDISTIYNHSGEMYFDSLMTIDNERDFVCMLPTGGFKIYMDSSAGGCPEEVVWRDSSRVLLATSGPRMFTEWKKRKDVPLPEERADRKVYVDSFLDGNGGLRYDRCNIPYQRSNTRIYYLNVREKNRHKMDSLFDRIIFVEGHTGPSSYIKVGDHMICNQ